MIILLFQRFEKNFDHPYYGYNMSTVVGKVKNHERRVIENVFEGSAFLCRPLNREAQAE